MDWKILSRSDIVLASSATIIILIAISIAAVLEPQQKTIQIVTVGPLWDTDSWTCTSNSDFIVFGTLRGLGDSQIALSVSGKGTQSLYSLSSGQLETFSVGGQANDQIIITRTGVVTGFITLHTSSGAEATCTQ